VSYWAMSITVVHSRCEPTKIGRAPDLWLECFEGPSSHQSLGRLCAVTLVLFLGSATLPVPCSVQRKPLGKDEVVRFLKGDVSPTRVAELARERGIDFQMTPQTESELRQAAASAGDEPSAINDLLATLRELAPKPEPAKPAKTGQPQPGTVRVNSKDGLKYVWIPPGSFEMGCSPGDRECDNDEAPAHQVTISKGFWLGQTAVTVGAYKRFTQAQGKSMPTAPNLMGRPQNSGWADEGMPIVDVTWDEAQDYCTRQGGRLPSEAEWEYAARAGNTESRYGPLDGIAWYADNSGRERLDSARIWQTDQANYAKRLNDNGNGMHEVAQKRANRFGLYDMLGNVWQWINDWYDANYYRNSPSQDPLGPATGLSRVLRGGTWNRTPWYVRASYRVRVLPGLRSPDIGFRCVGEVGNP